MRTIQNKKTDARKIILIFAGILALACIALVILEKTRVTNFIRLNPQAASQPNKTTSTAPSAQEDFQGGGDRSPVQTTPKEATATDNNGSIGSIPPESQWTTATSGAITVYNPAKDSLFSSGQALTGKATSDKVSFRLVDTTSGVIASGDIRVIDGKFSTTFSFTTSAEAGRIDIFTANADGVESNNIKIPVRFRQR